MRPSNPERWNDAEMLLWLRALDEADLEVTTWEADFIESLVPLEPAKISLSPKQRACIVRMANKYLSVR